MDLINMAGPLESKALVRAFGGLVIAVLDQTAAGLLARFGIPSVTKAGRVSRRGSLEGGWRPRQSGSHLPSPIARKLEADRLQARFLHAAYLHSL